MEAAIADNIALVSVRAGTHVCPPGGHRGPRAAVAASAGRPPHRHRARSSPVKTLSGGNQQKVVLAKWLLARPRCSSWTNRRAALTSGAKYEIYQLIHELADHGAGRAGDLVGNRGVDRHLRPHPGDEPRGDPRDLRREEFDRERILRAALKGP